MNTLRLVSFLLVITSLVLACSRSTSEPNGDSAQVSALATQVARLQSLTTVSSPTASSEPSLRTEPADNESVEEDLGLLLSSQVIQKYLLADIEVGPPEQSDSADYSGQAHKVKITLANTVPDNGDWPKVVFIGISLGIANLKRELPNQSGLPFRMNIKRPDVKEPSGSGEPLARFLRTHNYEFERLTSDEEVLGEALFPGQSIIYEITIPEEDIPFMEFQVRAMVSRRHLMQYQRTLAPPDQYSRPPIVSALKEFNTLEVHEPLDQVLNSMPEFGPETRLADLESFVAILESGISQATSTQTTLNAQYREAPNPKVRGHVEETYRYLDAVVAAFTRMKEAVGASNSDEIHEAATNIRNLKTVASGLNRETEDIRSGRSISDAEVDYAYRGR